ncbi:ABC transporter, ATP-binding protein, putative [Synechococcus sp. PCC 7335]|uniref:ABC transporter ATP-binding protein n=1 Tax=Synechococcus sp. (strain ATCC 29403 / PCC 7335) TaxID=91464 RepID=UPI00017EB4E4|nr:ABC transporter ATP-binding protein [Synechococcus sp. PCC 7335]EDX87264.1 ABC transporter, ATP-binding protein, putative [Synechococcus sp. PCC 7335]
MFGEGKHSFLAIDQFSLDVPAGEFVCLIGPSGCGKSTVLNTIAGFITPSQGTVAVDGYVIEEPGGDRGMVFQQPSLFPWKTVLGNVAHGPRMAGKPKVNAHKIAQDLLQMVGLAKFAKRYPMMLSGGMQQRVAIARALANSPRVLLMDEPFGALDAQTRFMMQENLLTLWSELKTTVVFVTHDIDEAIFLGDRVVVMSANPGQILKNIKISLPRPRTSDLLVDPTFSALKKDCFDLIRQESLQAFEQQL